MPKEMTKEQAIKQALRIKKLMAFVYKYGLFGQKRAKIGLENFIETRHGKVRVLQYGFENESVLPLYIDMHGGGFLLMHADADEAINIQFSRDAGVKIVSIDYPKAPEQPFPNAVEAISDVIRHYKDKAGVYKIDATRMGIGGHSAGANLATVTCLRDLKTKEFNFKYQVLDFPPLDLATNPYSKPKPKGSIPPKYATMFNLCYAGPETAEEPGVSPVLARIEDLKGMPSALIIVCGGDSLHDEGIKYAEMLRAAGTEVELHDYPTEKHGFIYFRPSSNVKEAIKYMTEFIRINAATKY